MKPGAAIPGLDIFKDKDPPVALERTEYPEWLTTLTEPLPSLAKLRRIPDEEATELEQRRFIKLIRRAAIKSNNESLKKS